ncbi:hypothetical protein GC194_03280 [bacterium]|nr:hypothetical protein [bacterium]
MGDRANYIIKRDKKFDIFYTHWRAILVAHDLTMGPNKFIQFVKQFDKADHIIDQPWIQACVLVDTDFKKLTFWELEILDESSIREEYLRQLASIWDGWSVQYAENEMYDIEKELNITYTKNQQIVLRRGALERIEDFVESKGYYSSVVVLIENGDVSVKYVKGGSNDEIALIGEEIIDKLRPMKDRELLREFNDDDNFICPVIIDIDHKAIWLDQTTIGLETALKSIWKDWQINLRNFGYIKLLNLVGINTNDLKLSAKEVKEFVRSEIFEQEDQFDPNLLAQTLKENIGHDITFNKHFF